MSFWKHLVIEQADKATDRARKAIKPGDKLAFRRCGGTKSCGVMTGWDGDWITTKTRDEIHALHIFRVNRVAVDFSRPYP